MRGRKVLAVLALAAVAGASLSACGSGKKSLTFCTDPTYAPAEYYTVAKQGAHSLDRTLTGADIDIAKAVAKKVDRDARFRDTAFPDTIPALLGKKCGAIISFMNDTPERRKQVTFVDYLAAGQSVLTKKTGPTITSVRDLYGKTVSVAKGTTEADFLAAANNSAPAGQSIQVKTYLAENNAILALQQGKVQVYFGDAPVVNNSAASDSSLQAGAQLVKPEPIGIALRPGDALVSKVRSAVAALYANGTIGSILGKWKLGQFAINPANK